MTFVKCPHCQQAYQVRRTVEYAEPFLCSVCGFHFNYGGAPEPRQGAAEVTLRLAGRMKVLHRAASRVPTIRPPAELREFSFDPDCDVWRLTELVKGYPTVLPPTLGEHPEENPEWALVAGHWRYVGEGVDVGRPVKEFISSYGELMADLRRRVAHVAVRLTARDLTTDPDIPQEDMNLPLDEGEGLLWRGLVRTESSAEEEWMFLTDRRVLYFGEGGPFEYRLEALKDVRTDWRDHGGNLRLEFLSGESVAFTGEEIWRPSLYLNYVWNRAFRMHFWTNDQDAVVRDLCDSLCNPSSFRDEETWPTEDFTRSFVFADLFEGDLMPRWHRCQW